MATNGKLKWIHYLVGLVMSLIIMWLSGLTTNVIANDKGSRLRDDELKDCVHIMQTEIVQRLTRIETKIDK